jgi:hypothetical protein
MVRPEGLDRWRRQMNPLRIEPATFCCVAQCLSHLRHRIPYPSSSYINEKPLYSWPWEVYFHRWRVTDNRSIPRTIDFVFALQKSCARRWIVIRAMGENGECAWYLKLFTDRKFLLRECNIWQCGNFMKYVFNKYTRENGLKLFSIVNWAIHGYDFRRCGEIFTFFCLFVFKEVCRLYSGKRTLGLPVCKIY